MKKLITVLLVLCLATAIFVACRARTDRAEDNGIVTDGTTKMTDTTNRNTDNTTTDKSTDKTTTDTDTKSRSQRILDGAGDAVSDVVRGATDAVDDFLDGIRDTGN
ncbi:MAG: hypothetical protein IKT46_01355 [Clostridia bacterium]|nr:hypothetical protein [Clostridia bacterium]